MLIEYQLTLHWGFIFLEYPRASSVVNSSSVPDECFWDWVRFGEWAALEIQMAWLRFELVRTSENALRVGC